MVLIKPIYRLLNRHFMLICLFLIAFGIVFSLIFFLGEDEKELSNFSEYDDKITFWSNDYHISPIQDLKHLLIPLDVRFIDKSLSGSCSVTKTCAKDLHLLSTINGMNP